MSSTFSRLEYGCQAVFSDILQLPCHYEKCRCAQLIPPKIKSPSTCYRYRYNGCDGDYDGTRSFDGYWNQKHNKEAYEDRSYPHQCHPCNIAFADSSNLHHHIRASRYRREHAHGVMNAFGPFLSILCLESSSRLGDNIPLSTVSSNTLNVVCNIVDLDDEWPDATDIAILWILRVAAQPLKAVEYPEVFCNTASHIQNPDVLTERIETFIHPMAVDNFTAVRWPSILFGIPAQNQISSLPSYSIPRQAFANTTTSHVHLGFGFRYSGTTMLVVI